MNQVVLIGRIVKEPELKTSRDGKTTIANITVAVNRKFKKGEADFINCSAFNKQAETIVTYMSKGSQIALTGELRIDNYKKDDGTWANNTKVIINNFDFIDSGKKESNEVEENNESKEQQLKNVLGDCLEVIDDDQDIPF